MKYFKNKLFSFSFGFLFLAFLASEKSTDESTDSVDAVFDCYTVHTVCDQQNPDNHNDFLAFSQNSSIKKPQEVIIEYRAEIQQKYVDSFVTALNNKKDVTMAVKQQVSYNYMNADPEYFTLKIRGNESYYSQNKSLNLDGEYNMGSNAPDQDFYSNMEQDLVVELNPYFGNIKRNPMDWTIISSSTKSIG